ncbi:MAG: hypothetical protein N3G77_01490 [Nitrososphaeria archaeon]|nr:hypothetical protein [Nitrososphaeria archaeon]
MRFLSERGLVNEYEIYVVKSCRDGRERLIREHSIRIDWEALNLLEYAPTSYTVEEKIEWVKSRRKAIHHPQIISTTIDLLVDLLLQSNYHFYIDKIEPILLSNIPPSLVFLKDLEKIKLIEGKRFTLRELPKIFNVDNLRKVPFIVKSVFANFLRYNLKYASVCWKCFLGSETLVFIRDKQCPLDPEHSATISLYEVFKILEKARQNIEQYEDFISFS